MNDNSRKKLSESLMRNLVLEGFPVGVKMIETSEELDAIQYKGQPLKRLEKELAACQPISQARYLGRVMGIETWRVSVCRLGGDVLGVDVGDYVHVYTNTYFQDADSARNMIATTPRFERGKYQAMVVGPLEKIPVEPDVVVVYGNVAQILRIINGYLYDKGGRLQFSASGDAGLCSDTIVLPMQSGRPHVAIPCNGGRILGLPNNTDLACGIPYGLLEGILEGIEFTGKNVPIGYPPRWQFIDWELPSKAPVKSFLRQNKE